MVDEERKKVLFLTSLFKKEELEEWAHLNRTTLPAYFNKLFAPYNVEVKWDIYWPNVTLVMQSKQSNPTPVEDILSKIRELNPECVVIDPLEYILSNSMQVQSSPRNFTEFNTGLNGDSRNRSYLYRVIGAGNTGLSMVSKQFGTNSGAAFVNLDEKLTLANLVLDVMKEVYKQPQQRRY